MSAPMLTSCRDRILALQAKSGAIRWIDSGIFDPWNHTESAMALCAAGAVDAARKAYDYLVHIQRSDGALPGQCGASVPLDKDNAHLLADQAKPLIDTNFTGYCALGIWHLYCATCDVNDLKRYADLVIAAMDFVLAHQSPHGDIAWRAKEDHETLEEVDALRSGNCALYKSLHAAQLICEKLDLPHDHYRAAQSAIGEALRHKPERFDRTWPAKDRYAMDWYYPVLTGVIDGQEACSHLAARQDEFIDHGLGCRCVSDQPWTTVAETCELALALIAIDRKDEARTLLQWVTPLHDERGGFAMGWQSQEQIIWPQERPSWTAAAYILAHDALNPDSRTGTLLAGALTPRAAKAPTSVSG